MGSGSIISSALPFIVIAVIFISLLPVLSRKGHISISGPTLVLKKFEINRTPTSDTDEIINIVGRVGGLISWVFTVIGLEPEYFLKVTGREIRIKRSSLFGQQYALVALTSISSVHCGYLKPIGYLIFAAFSVLSGLFMWSSYNGKFTHFLFGLIVGAVFITLYWLLKKIEISIHTRGNLPLGLVFKRSVIENVPVDIERAKLTIEIINNLIVKSQKREMEIQDIVTESAKNLELKSGKSISMFCKNCGSPLDEGAIFCSSCGRSV